MIKTLRTLLNPGKSHWSPLANVTYSILFKINYTFMFSGSGTESDSDDSVPDLEDPAAAAAQSQVNMEPSTSQPSCFLPTLLPSAALPTPFRSLGEAVCSPCPPAHLLSWLPIYGALPPFSLLCARPGGAATSSKHSTLIIAQLLCPPPSLLPPTVRWLDTRSASVFFNAEGLHSIYLSWHTCTQWHLLAGFNLC